jgi:hypothetical protein
MSGTNEKDKLILNTSPELFQDSISRPAPVHESHNARTPTSAGGLRRSSALAVRRQSTLTLEPGEDEDAKAIRESVRQMRRLQVDESPRARDSWLNPTEYDRAAAAKPTSNYSSPEQEKKRYPAEEPQEDNLFDGSFAREDSVLNTAAAAIHWSETKPASPVRTRPMNGTKVMSAKEFERLRQEEERLKGWGGKKAESDDENDSYEDEEPDEEEKRREQARQRKKQEAHMSVYRQQMMKITGEPNQPVPRPMTQMMSPMPGMDIPDPEDEDEDVPLAILQAHGFPNKARQPGMLHSMNSNPNLRASTQMGAYPPPPMSVTGGQEGGNRGSVLPPFARRLPQDPYISQQMLLNDTNRQSLAMGGGSQFGGGSGSGMGPLRQGPPGGLVGVIANEERSRAMRRGSPNAQGEYPGLPRSMTMGSNTGGMGMIGPPDDAAQLKMQNQQIIEGMAIMMQMMASGVQPSPQMMQGIMGPMPGAPSVMGMAPPGPGQMHPGMARASTMLNMNGGQMQLPMPGQSGSRPGSAMGLGNGSFMPRNSFMPGPGMNGGYAPSIAPSERSNVGMPGRYRPVSHAPGADFANMQQPPMPSRASTMMSGGLSQPYGGNGSTISLVQQGQSIQRKQTPLVTISAEDDEDEEEGWAEMRARKEKARMERRERKANGGGALNGAAPMSMEEDAFAGLGEHII